MPDIPVVLHVGPRAFDRIESPASPLARGETRELDLRTVPSDAGLMRALAEHRPAVILTVGDPALHPELMAAPYDVRRRWVSLPEGATAEHAGRAAFECYLSLVTSARPGPPLISVFTAAYRTGLPRLERALASLRAQEYGEWEWVVVDDSGDGGETLDHLAAVAGQDPRVRFVGGGRRSGSIGDVKRAAADLCRGEYLVELDHDDLLLPGCLGWLVSAFQAHPGAGFAYTDCVEVHEAGGYHRYEDGWGWGAGGYYWTDVTGARTLVTATPDITPKTIRSILAAPNHARAWTARAYREAGGHSPDAHVADDYDLMVRTFLTTRMAHVVAPLYVQYFEASSATFRRNAEIQRLVRAFSERYDRRVHDRVLELGGDDYMWDEVAGRSRHPGAVADPPGAPPLSIRVDACGARLAPPRHEAE